MKMTVNPNYFHHPNMAMAMAISKSKTIMSLSPSLSSLHFSTYPQQQHNPSRRFEEESRNVRVSVWWDFENCHIPSGINVFKVAHSITAAVRANGIKGPIQITAFGDFLQLSRSNQEAMSSTGINLAHIPNGGKNSADRSLLFDLMYWVSQNPPPAHLFLISGDRDFASVLHRLRMNNYNILLASTESAPSVLCSAASIMWNWSALLKGENLAGKHFNQPPDGPYGSWYGHYKLPLEDPFFEIEKPITCPKEPSSDPSTASSDAKLHSIPKLAASAPTTTSSDVKLHVIPKITASSVFAEDSCPSSSAPRSCSSDIKVRPIPKTVIKQIRQILNSHPKGISIIDLRTELHRSSVALEKDLYGYRKFSRLLLAMPQIVGLQTEIDGQIILHSIGQKPDESVLCKSSVPVSKNGQQDFSVGVQSKVEDTSPSKAANEKFHTAVGVQEPPIKLNMSVPPPHGKVVTEMKKSSSNQNDALSVGSQDSPSDMGFFKRIWKNWFLDEDIESGKINQGLGQECSSYEEKTKSKENNLTLIQTCADTVIPDALSSPSNDLNTENKSAFTLEEPCDTSKTTDGFFSQFFNGFKFWSPKSDTSNDQSSIRLNQMNVSPTKQDIFTKDTFWLDVGSFIATPKGSGIVTHSKTRCEMANNLQKDGPLILKSLTEKDLLYLVDLLISEKKWVDECSSRTSPFKLTHNIGKNSCLNGSHSESKGLPEHERKKTFQNLPDAGVSSTPIIQKSEDRPRSEIIASCQLLVDEILKKYPDGFNIVSFRKLFAERYGYPLDVQNLGYQKLASLLQKMPGVKIESNFIVPSGKVSKASISSFENRVDSQLSGPLRKHDSFECQWEELGPVEDSGKIAKKKDVGHKYEAAMSDDELTDSEEESTQDRKGKHKDDGEDSPLLQILDSWSHNGRKPRPQKSYKFVSDSGEDNNDRLVNGILGTLKKSSETHMRI